MMKATVNAGAVLFVRRVGSGRGVGIHWWARYLDGLPLWMNEWMNEFVFAPSYRDLSRGCCVSIIYLLIQFSLSLLSVQYHTVHARTTAKMTDLSVSASSSLMLTAGDVTSPVDFHIRHLHRVSEKGAFLFLLELCQILPILINFGRKMAKWLKLYATYTFSTSPNLCHCTTLLNTDHDVPNCYTTLEFIICKTISHDWIITQ